VIKKINPIITYNKNSEIAFIYIFTKNIFEYSKHSIMNVLSYIKKHNYAFIIYDKLFCNSVAPCWNKILAILKNIKKYKYIVWFDADAIILNFDITIESIIEKNNKVDLYLCNDIAIDKECINSGIMIIKNTEWSYNLFKKVWDSPILHLHNDQNVIYHEIVKEVYPDSNPPLKFSIFCNKITHSKVQIFPENLFNTHILNYNTGDFIIHLMGAPNEVRADIMRQINTNLGLDNYNKKKCFEIINMPKNQNRTFLINNFCLNKN
jgi:hypothetical protein